MNKIELPKIVKPTKRLGRGMSSGRGKNSGRGENGQKSRAGASTSQFEGGQTKFIMRLPKAKGFRSKTTKRVVALTTDQINLMFKDGEVVGVNKVAEKLGLCEKSAKVLQKVKIIKKSDLVSNVKFDETVVFSKSLQPSKQ